MVGESYGCKYRVGCHNGVSVDVRGMVADIWAIPLPLTSPMHSNSVNALLSLYCLTHYPYPDGVSQ